MLKIDRQYVEKIQKASRKEELHDLVQKAIELEHATIPPYLTAMFSLKSGVNDEVGRLIRQVVVEEMSHMTIAANLLLALGGHPNINQPGFIPQYPGPLPMGIGGDDFIVPIAPFSKSLVKEVFMTIEEPEDPVPIKIMKAAAPTYATIGEFYEALKTKIRELGNGIFVGDPNAQVLKWFSPDRVFAITDVDTACRAIDVIVVEGEGTSSDPFQSPGNPAHYYKFSEIYHGKKIVETPDGYAYAGDAIPLDESGIYPMKRNCKIADFQTGSKERILIERYCYSYSSLLNALHQAFNENPGHIDAAMGLMYELKLQAVMLMSTPIGDGPETLGPSYEYVNVQGGVSSPAV